MFALGNEIPPGVVRWHGRLRVERFLREPVRGREGRARPRRLFTYVNFPPTEFLDLSFFDVCAFNVYLHREAGAARLPRAAAAHRRPQAAAAGRSGRRQHPRRRSGPGRDHRDAHPRRVRGRRVRRGRVRVDRRVVARRPSPSTTGRSASSIASAARSRRRAAVATAFADAPFSRRAQRTLAARLGRRLRLQRRRHARRLPARRSSG